MKNQTGPTLTCTTFLDKVASGGVLSWVPETMYLRPEADVALSLNVVIYLVMNSKLCKY